jgi:hypothetical protein
MSRRSHHVGRHHGRPHKAAERRPAAPSALAPGVPPQADDSSLLEPFDALTEALTAGEAPIETSLRLDVGAPLDDAEPVDRSFESVGTPSPEPTAYVAEVAIAPVDPDTHVNGEAHAEPHLGTNGDGHAGTCTAPQLRRFIKSRAYVPMHELRRRFAINGSEDDVTQVDLNARRIYVGLPEREGRLLGELLRGGDVGFELSLDPITPIVVGVYPMRPVPRP